MLIKNSKQPPFCGPSQSEWQDRKMPLGWLPIDITPNVSRLRWIKIGVAALDEPFFGDTLRRLRAAVPSAPEYETDISVVTSGREENSFAPAGIIVHMTRCGSTLVANALRKAERAVVLGEAPVIGGAIEALGSRSRYWSKRASQYLPALTAVFAQYQGGIPRQVIIKCGLEGIHSLAALRAIWPAVPCLILIRDPIEVLVSIHSGPPVWYQLWYDDIRRVAGAGRPPADVVTGNVIDYCAWGIGSRCSETLAAGCDGYRILDYSEITPQVIKKVYEYFGLCWSTEAERALEELFQRDAKRPGRKFNGDSDRKRNLVSDEIRAAAAKWMEGPYQELRRLSTSWNVS